MSQEVNLKDFEWGGMLSIWGQKDLAFQGACYSGLAYNPHDYINIIAPDGPPVEKWMLRYVDLELANFWLTYCINHVIPEEVLKHIVFTRVHSKAHWPSKYAEVMPEDEVIDAWDYDEGDEEDNKAENQRLRDLQKQKFGGTLPWLKVSFSQQLPASVIFSVGVLLRYASEHGPTLKMLQLLPELAPNIPQDSRLSVAVNIGGARGHSLGGWGWGYLSQFRKVADKFSWKKGFMLMMKDKPFFAQPMKMRNVDDCFMPTWGNRKAEDKEVCTGTYTRNPIQRDGLFIMTKHNVPNELLALWDKKEKA